MKSFQFRFLVIQITTKANSVESHLMMLPGKQFLFRVASSSQIHHRFPGLVRYLLTLSEIAGVTAMMSIKDKIDLMIFLAKGELVRHCHAVEAGILVNKPVIITPYKPKKRRKDNK